LKNIAFHIEKGGTGKTTMAGNVGFELAYYGKTLLIDGDPQGNLTSWYHPDAIEYDLADVLQQKARLSDAITEIRDNLFLLPTIAIGGELKTWADHNQGAASDAIGYLLDDAGASGFRTVVFDLGPGISDFERSILARMHEVIGVTSAEYFSADGIEIFEHELKNIIETRRAGFVANKLVINRFYRGYAQHAATVRDIEDSPYIIFKVGQSTAISDCVPAHKSLFEYDPGNRYTSEIQRIAKAVCE
jgi:chromosome partitioning protein